MPVMPAQESGKGNVCRLLPKIVLSTPAYLIIGKLVLERKTACGEFDPGREGPAFPTRIHVARAIYSQKDH